MRKLYLYFLFGTLVLILGIGLGFALDALDKSIGDKFTSDEKRTLETMDLGDWKIIDYNLADGSLQRCLYKEGAIDFCGTFKSTATARDMEDWEVSTMKMIAKNEIERRDKTKTGEGTTTIK